MENVSKPNELKLAQLMVSRICHDLAGGVGAINNGAELLSEDGAVDLDDAVDLIAQSAHQTSRRLQFMRLAFGQGGGEDGRIALDQVRNAVQDFIAGGRTSLVWDMANERVELPAGKLLANLCLTAAECLPRGGSLAVDGKPVEGHWGFAVAARGQGARLDAGVADAMTQEVPISQLSPRTVHGRVLSLLARETGAELEVSTENEGEIRLAALLASA